METLTVNGFEINAGCWPPVATKPTLLMIHGASLSKAFWDLQVSALSDHANTIAIDLPGHGGTEIPSSATVKSISEAILPFLEALDSGSGLIICGMSMGGAIAQQLLIDHPALFKAGILLNTGSRLKVLPMIFDMVKTDYQGYQETLPRLSISSKSDAEKIATLSKEFSGKCSAETTLNDFNACNSFDIMEQIGKISCPILVMAATEDMSTPLKYGQWLHQNIKGSTFVEIPDAGHFSPLEKPDEVNQAIKDFIEKI